MVMDRLEAPKEKVNVRNRALAACMAVSFAVLMLGGTLAAQGQKNKPTPKKPAKTSPKKGGAKALAKPAAGGANPLIAQGQKLYTGQGCNVCHAIGGKGGAIGPDLSTEGAKHDPKWIQDHIMDPKKHTPTSTMPAYGDRIKGKEMQALVSYISSLGGKGTAPAPTGGVSGGGAPPAPKGPKADPTVIARIEKAGGAVRE